MTIVSKRRQSARGWRRFKTYLWSYARQQRKHSMASSGPNGHGIFRRRHVHQVTTDPLEQELTPTAELLRTHYKLAHLSFKDIQTMAKKGHLPSRLADCRIPRCSGCLFGKATRRPWRTKSPSNAKIRIATKPGQCISVDQLESPTPGLFGQLKGTPTLKRYKAATVFVDHFSRLSYVHLQESLTSADTLKAKHAFEKFCGTHGVQVQHYHCDNGRFADNAFITDVFEQHQNISYCGVNAHFQNGVAEKRIRDLQDLTRTSLLHATARWPKAISVHLWPYALRTPPTRC